MLKLLPLFFFLFSPLLAETKKQLKIAQSSLSQLGKTTTYNPAYVKLKYPNGDVPIKSGVCTDVVIRSLRGINIDLQKLVHLDMKKNFSKYPKNWGLKRPDKNIDHRRVPNLMCYFKRNGWSLPTSKRPRDYQRGDIVVWKLGKGLLHTGVIAKYAKGKTRPLIVHNIGSGAQVENFLFSAKIIGHYRYKK